MRGQGRTHPETTACPACEPLLRPGDSPAQLAEMQLLIDFGVIRRPYVLSGRRPKPDVGNPLITGACAFTGEPAGHARMPPGRRNLPTELMSKGVSTPLLPAFTGAGIESRSFPRCASRMFKLGRSGANGGEEGEGGRSGRARAGPCPAGFHVICNQVGRDRDQQHRVQRSGANRSKRAGRSGGSVGRDARVRARGLSPPPC